MHCEKSLLYFGCVGVTGLFFKCWYSLLRWPKLFHKIILISICANTNIYDVSLFQTNQQSLISCFGENSNNHTLFFSFWLQNCTAVCILVPYIKNKLPFHVNSWRQISYVTEIQPPCLNFRVSSFCNWTCLITDCNVNTCYSTVKLFNKTFCY